MGFLSRKKKHEPTNVVEETRPLEEELQRMEEAVPERPVNDYEPEAEYDEPDYDDDADEAPPAAGPVADEAPAPAPEPPAPPLPSPSALLQADGCPRRLAAASSCGLEIPLRGYSDGTSFFLP